MLRAPNCDRAPKPRMEMRVSCDGFVRFATVTPGSSDSVCSTSMCVWPGSKLSGRVVLIAYGRSSGERPMSRVTVTTGGSFRGSESCAPAEDSAAHTASATTTVRRNTSTVWQTREADGENLHRVPTALHPALRHIHPAARHLRASSPPRRHGRRWYVATY